MSNAYGVWMLVRREMARYTNVWGQTIVPPVVSAVLFLFVFGHALGDRIKEFDGVPYLTFIVPGLIIQGAITNAYANNGTSMFDSRRAGYIEDVLTSPLKDWHIILSYALAGTSRGVIIGLLTLLVALPVASGWDIHIPLFLFVLVVASLVFSLVGVLAGLFARRWDHVFVPQTFLLLPLTFLGGVFYPVHLLSDNLELASRFNPILYIVEAQRAATVGGDLAALLPSVIGLVALAALLFVVTLALFKRHPNLRG